MDKELDCVPFDDVIKRQCYNLQKNYIGSVNVKYSLNLCCMK